STPEATYTTLSDVNGFISTEHIPSLKEYDAIAMGIGMGREEETSVFLKTVIDQALCPIVIDADGLFHLKSHIEELAQIKQPIIITPHPGEMARLLGIPVSKLMESPFNYSLQFAKTHHSDVVLTGRFTMITTAYGERAVNISGNRGLARGGGGDVLTGIILAMVMQEMSIFHALCNACFLPGMSADLQVKEKHSHYDLTATDVMDGLSKVFRAFLH